MRTGFSFSTPSLFPTPPYDHSESWQSHAKGERQHEHSSIDCCRLLTASKQNSKCSFRIFEYFPYKTVLLAHHKQGKDNIKASAQNPITSSPSFPAFSSCKPLSMDACSSEARLLASASFSRSAADEASSPRSRSCSQAASSRRRGRDDRRENRNDAADLRKSCSSCHYYSRRFGGGERGGVPLCGRESWRWNVIRGGRGVVDMSGEGRKGQRGKGRGEKNGGWDTGRSTI